MTSGDQRDTEDTESTAQKKGHDNFINSLKKFLEDDVLKAVVSIHSFLCLMLYFFYHLSTNVKC